MKTEEGKTIKDYLHLYPKVAIAICEPGIEPVPHYLEGYDWCLDKAIAERVNYNPSWIKPILRPLSDMTEEEAWDGWRFVTDPHYYHVSNPKYALEHGELNISTSEWANVVRWLLSKHFDLFGLIKSGLAIDKTKTKSQ